MENNKPMRHRRTKAEMELAREIETNEKNEDKPKQKRHRRTKVEMELARETTDDVDISSVKTKISKPTYSSCVNETVKLKYESNGIPKDTILKVIETPTNQTYDYFYIWVEYNGIKKKIMRFSVFFVR